MSNHTPGPWKIDYGSKTKTARGISAPAARRNIVNFNGLAAPMSAETAANAQLLAAAPDMLQALRKAVVLLAGACVHAPESEPHETYEAVSAAIAKATGCAA